VLVTAYMAQGKMVQADQEYRRIVQDGQDKDGLANNYAWSTLVTGQGLEQGLATFRTAIDLDKADNSQLNTLAALEAANGNLLEATRHLQSSLPPGGYTRLDYACRFVQGLIAEQLGLKADARKAFEQAMAEDGESSDPASVYLLAKHRLETL